MASLTGAVFADFSTLADGDCLTKAVTTIGPDTSFENAGSTPSGAQQGGAGNDVYLVDDQHVNINDEGGEDIVVSSTSYHLGRNVEHLILTGSDNTNGSGNALNNVIAGNDGNNDLNGGAGDDVLVAGKGDDCIQGGAGDDYLCGGDGNDELRGGAGNDVLTGGEGDDALHGGAGMDTLDGGDGNDVLEGEGSEDLIDGGLGHDCLVGGGSDDTLIGNAGNDILEGDGGHDVFVFNDGSGEDVIVDFAIGQDTILLSANINGTGFTTGADVLAAVTGDLDGNAVINLGAGNNLTLLNVNQDDVTADFFQFT